MNDTSPVTHIFPIGSIVLRGVFVFSGNVSSPSIGRGYLELNSDNYRVSIDKIDLGGYRFPMSILLDHWKAVGLPFIESRVMNNKRMCLKCNGFQFHRNFTETELIKITTNPNCFQSYFQYIDALKKTLPVDLYSNLSIVRLDIALDFFNVSFDEINQTLVMQKKQHIERFVNESSKEGSRYFGKGDEVFLLYDKKHFLMKKRKRNIKRKDTEALENEEFVRLEVKLTRKKIPTKSLGDLPQALLCAKYNPFNVAHLLMHDLVPRKIKFPIKNIDQFNSNLEWLYYYIRLQAIIETSGFQYAKRYSSRDRESKLYFDKFLIEKERLSLGDFYKDGIIKYFECIGGDSRE